jgi:hypothetical protein
MTFPSPGAAERMQSDRIPYSNIRQDPARRRQTYWLMGHTPVVRHQQKQHHSWEESLRTFRIDFLHSSSITQHIE